MKAGVHDVVGVPDGAHCLGERLVRRGKQMAAGVDRRLDVVVAEQLHHEVEVGRAAEGDAGAGVS
jgi:hypothetical protein